MKQYFLDSSSTTRPYDEVIDTMSDVMRNHYGNPSSTHEMGVDAKRIIERVRDQIAEDINCEPSEIIFTSGACEANTLAYSARYHKPPGFRYALSSDIEHKSLELINKEYANFVKNDSSGNILLNELEMNLLNKRYPIGFITIQAANSEIGTIQDVKSIADIVHSYDAIFHTDATQLYPERRINVKKLGIDLMSVSAQKFHGPKGVGFLYCKNGIELEPLISGSQEHGIRGGTYNTEGIAGMGKALELTRHLQDYRNVCIKFNRDSLYKEIMEIHGVRLNGPDIDDNRLYNNLSLRIDGVKANDLVTMASMHGIYISAGSACSSGDAIPSSTLKAIGLTDEEALSTIRITVDETLNQHDIMYIAKVLRGLIDQLRTS